MRFDYAQINFMRAIDDCCYRAVKDCLEDKTVMGSAVDTLTVMASVAKYLKNLDVEDALSELELIVSPGIKSMAGVVGSTAERRDFVGFKRVYEMVEKAAKTVSTKLNSRIDADRLVSLINKASAGLINGKKYILRMPVCVATFITNCYLECSIWEAHTVEAC